MKKLALVLSLVAVFSAMSISVSAATPPTRWTNSPGYEQNQITADEVIKELNARKEALKSQLDSGLITQAQYDRANTEIDAAIADIKANGLYGANGEYGYGYGYCRDARAYDTQSGGMMGGYPGSLNRTQRSGMMGGIGNRNYSDINDYGYGRGRCH